MVDEEMNSNSSTSKKPNEKSSELNTENNPSSKEALFFSIQSDKSKLPGKIVRNGEISSTGIMTAGEYAKAVNQWLHHCYYWQSIAVGFPYFLASVIHQNQGGNLTFRGPHPVQNFYSHVSNQPVVTSTNVVGREFLIPPLWKRFFAELIDFFILFMLKLFVTFLAIDFFEVIDLEKYDLETIKEELLDYKLAFEVTSEIVMLEIIHRFVVCLFEALCLYRGTLSEGGATPGKSILGLKVVSCENIQDTINGRVLVRPGRDIGFLWALLRSFIKNFSIAFFFPVCFTLFMFQHNRSAYDIFCNSVVVEDVPSLNQARM